MADIKGKGVGCHLQEKPNLSHLEPAGQTGQRSPGPLKVELEGLARIHKSRERNRVTLASVFNLTSSMLLKSLEVKRRVE